MASPIVTLLTDFGLTDTYVGQMRGVIAGIAPETTVIDLTHGVAPQNVLQGAILLADAVEAFPAGTIHVAVVDPSVGSKRRAIAAEIGPWLFVGPDNGILTEVMARSDDSLGTIVELNKTMFWRDFLSQTFHGRDLFAPVAAHLSRGVKLKNMGRPLDSPLVELQIPRMEIDTPVSVRGEVLYADHFGNLITNVTGFPDLFDERDLVHVDAETTVRIVTCYAESRPGELVALIGSSGRLELAVVGGSAAERLQAGAGWKVTISRAAR